MSNFPYINTTAKLREFINKIPEMGVPDSVTTKWLPTIGFGSVNHRRILGIMRFIGFLEGTKPTQRWLAFRDNTQAKGVMAGGILAGYADLFGLYEDAHSRSDAELKYYFRGKMTGGDQVIASTVNTFKALCSFADFGSISQPPSAIEPEISSGTEVADRRVQIGTIGEHVVTPNIEIQIQIDYNMSVEQINVVFDNIAKLLFSRQEEETEK